jgi:hypothetical protein
VSDGVGVGGRAEEASAGQAGVQATHVVAAEEAYQVGPHQ